MVSLVGKQILVTGAASGIGQACALGFQKDGAQVFGADIDLPGLDKLAPFGVIPIQADCAKADDVRLTVDSMLRHTEHIDVLVLNAGYGMQKSIDKLQDGEFEHLVAVQLFGAVNAMRAATPVMKAQGDGRVIIMLSRGAEGDEPGNSAYAAAKAALWALMRTAAAELKGHGVLVNGIIPGMTNTAIWGRPRPELQPPEAVYPAVRELATLELSGPSGRVFYRSAEYPMFRRSLPGEG